MGTNILSLSFLFLGAFRHERQQLQIATAASLQWHSTVVCHAEDCEELEGSVENFVAHAVLRVVAHGVHHSCGTRSQI